MENQNPLDKLYEVVSREGLYTKSKNDFIKKYSNPQEIDKLYDVVSREQLFTKNKDDFYSKYYPDLKKKEPEVSPYVSAPTKSPLQSPDFSQGQKMAEVGYTMPSAKREKEKIRVSPKLFGMPGEVDVEVVDDEATYRNTAQRFANDLLKGGAEIGAYVSEVMRDMGARQAKGIAKLTGNKEAKRISEQLGTPLYDKEGNLTEYAKNISWATDPTAKTILGLNGIKETTEELQADTRIPGAIGGTIESVSSFTPDILFSTLAPETKLAEGAGLIAKVGQKLINPFTKYLMVKEPLVAYGKAKRQGETAGEALKETPMGLVKGTATGAALALTGRISEAATKGIMTNATKYLLGSASQPASKTILTKAAELGLTGKGGVATRELINTATDVIGYALLYPTASSLVEKGELPTQEELMQGVGPAIAFRIKGAYENAKTFGELNRAVDQIQATKQGAAFVNFMEATPESILKVYNGKETAAELNLQAMEAAKRAKAEVDPEEKQKAVIQASTLAKAANVKQMADMVVSNKDGFQDFINSDIPQPVKAAFIEKATAINKEANPTEKLKTSIGNRMKQSQDFVERMERDMQAEQDPVRKAEMQVQIDNANKVYKQQEAELKKLIFDQFQPRNFDANDIKAIKENQRLDNLEIDNQISHLDRNDPDFAEKIESLTKKKDEQNDYYDQLLKQNKEAEESGVSVITPDEMNQVETIEIAPEKQDVNDFANRIAAGERMTSPEDLQFYENNKSEIEAALREKARPAEIKEAPKQKLDQENRTYTTKSGRQTVEYENGQLIVKDIKTGKEVSDATRKKAIDEYIESFDFAKGEMSYDVVAEAPSGLNEEEIKRFTVENSKNPLEIAQMYVMEPRESKLDTIEQMIADYGLGKLTQKGFERFGDRNLITGGMAKTYFNKEGTPIDVRAKEMSDYYGVEITPKNVIDFMIAYPSGASQAVKAGETRVAREAAERFKDLTGIDLNSTTAAKVIDAEMAKAEAFEQELIKQEYETRQQLEDEYWKASAEADRLAEEGNRPTAETAEKTTAVEPKKEVTLQDIYDALPKSERLRNEQVKEMVDKNFEGIIKQLEKYKEC